MSKSEVVAFIFARGGSKGVKDKNIRELAGKPLIHYSIESAKQSKFVERVVVSTDSDKIAEISANAGAEIIRRPSHLASDTSPEIFSWRHAIDVIEPEVFISIPATSPLRHATDIDSAINRFREGRWDIVFGISPSRRNPYLNMVEITADEGIKVVCGDKKQLANMRQDVPKVFDITTCVYVTTPNYIRKCKRLVDGKVGYIEIPPERSIDIDDEYDFYLADLILKNPITKKEGGIS